MIPLHVPPLTLKEASSLPKEDYINKFNDLLREYFGKETVILTGDARNSIYIALKIMNLKKEDEILIPGYICDAVPAVVKSVCKPVYVDIDSRTFNIDPDQIKKYITKNTKGILAAHLYGNPCEIDRIIEIAKAYNLQIIEDCAQSLGGTYHSKKLGSFGDFSVLSFRFSKDITSFRGGALLTNSRFDYEMTLIPLFKIIPGLFITLIAFGKIRCIPSFIYARIRSQLLGPLFTRTASQFDIHNESLCNYQCFLLYQQFNKLNTIIEQRRKNAIYYSRKLADIVNVPEEIDGIGHTYYRYTIQVENRNALVNYFLARGIEVDKMYNYSLSNLPNSSRAARMNINIPVHHMLSNEDKDKVIRYFHEFI